MWCVDRCRSFVVPCCSSASTHHQVGDLLGDKKIIELYKSCLALYALRVLAFGKPLDRLSTALFGLPNLACCLATAAAFMAVADGSDATAVGSPRPATTEGLPCEGWDDSYAQAKYSIK